jgi:hypothetical protein
MGWGCALVLVSAFIEAALVSVAMVLRNPVNFLWIFQGSWFLERASVGAGLWLLSMREPANAGDRRLLRYVIRVAAFAQFSDVVSVAARELVGLPILNRYMEPVLMLEAIVVATATWGGYLRLGRLMHCDRSSRILATAAKVLAWVWPALMIIQAFQFQSMRAGSRLYLPMPIPLVGEVEAGVLALYGLVLRQYFVSDFWFWTIAVGLTIGSVLLLLRIGVKFFVVAAHGQRIIACPPHHC